MAGVPLKTKVSGIVKAVPSGDTVTLMKPMTAGARGPPPEIRLSLSSLKAPALRPDGNDEPYAFASREFLRKRLIGRQVTFVLEYHVPRLNRYMGSIFVPPPSAPKSDGENGAKKAAAPPASVSREVLRRGLASVRRPNNADEQRSFEYDELCALEDQAVAEKVGIHEPGVMPAELGRSLLPTPSVVDFLRSVKGVPQHGVVEYVMNGSVMKVLMKAPDSPGSFYQLTVCLSGVQAPGFTRVEGDSAKEGGGAGGGAATQLVPKPFALNARFFTETRLLHRDVEVLFEGVDRNDNLYGEVKPTSASDDDGAAAEPSEANGAYIASALLKAGLAKTVSWGLEFCGRTKELRAAEKAARDARAGVWKDYVPNPNAASSASDEYSAKVVEVISGESLVVMKLPGGGLQRINLSSVRAPKLGRGGQKDAPMAWEAREYLRNRLIGRSVWVSHDYSRPPPPGTSFTDPLVFATVYKERGGKHSKADDVALGLLSGGYVNLVRHRSDEERARHYEEYVQLERDAAAAKTGVHSSTPAAVRRVNDLTGEENKKRSKEMLSFYERSSPLRGILEYASTGSRVRIYLPKESSLIVVALKGVRAAAPTRSSSAGAAAGGGRPADAEQKGEAFGDQALQFVRANFLQRDVVVDISGVDRTGAYLGAVRLAGDSASNAPPPAAAAPGGEGGGSGGAASPPPSSDIATALLEAGLGRLNEFFDATRDGGERLVEVEAAAREARKGLWQNYKEPVAAPAEDSASRKNARTVNGTVVELGYGGRMFMHADGVDAQLRALEDALSDVRMADARAPPSLSAAAPQSHFSRDADAVVAARFSQDNRWYRARVLARDGASSSAHVRFVDFGNEEVLSLSQLRALPPAAAATATPPLAQELTLYGVVVPDAGHELCDSAGEALRKLVFGRQVSVQFLDGTAAVVNLGGGAAPSSTSPSSAAAPSSSADGAGAGGAGAEEEEEEEEDKKKKKNDTDVAALLLRQGLARIERSRSRSAKDAAARYADDERVAREEHVNLWRFGDAYASDEDESEQVKAQRAARR